MDSTELRHLPDEGEQARATLQQMLDCSPAAISLLEARRDEQGRLLDFVFRGFNKAAERINRVPAAELLGRGLLELYPQAQDVFFADYAAVVDSGRPFRAERHYQGERVDLWFDVSAVKSGDGLILTYLDITERKQHEQSQEQMLNTANAAICILDAVRDAGGSIVDFCWRAGNQAAAQLLGRPVAEMRGRHLLELWPGVRDTFFPHYVRTVETGETTRVQQYYPHEGFDHWFDTTAVKSGDGFTLTFYDVTAQRHTEQELLLAQQQLGQQTADRYQALFNSIDEGFCLFEALFDAAGQPYDYRYLAVNPAFERHSGMPGPVGRTVREVLGELEPFWFETYGRVMLSGEPARFVSYAAPLQRWFDVHAFRIGDGTARHLGALFTDVTEQRRAEQALRESEARFRLMADAVPQIVWITDAEGRTEFFNRQWTAYTGKPYEPTNTVDVTADVVHPADAALTTSRFEEARRRRAPFEVEHRIRGANGEYRWFLVRAEPYFDPHSGELTRWFGASVDIHDRKLSEQALRRAQERHAFLLQLSDRLRALVDVGDIQYQAARALGQHLGADRVGYAEAQPDGETVVVARNYTHGVPGVEGPHRLADYGPEVLRQFRAGRSVGHADVARDPDLSPAEKQAHAVLHVGATLSVPLLKQGQLAGVFFVHYRQAHAWTEEEISLIEVTAERTWAAVARARAETALRQSELRLQKALSIETVGVMFFDMEGRIHDANDAFLRMSGYSRADFTSRLHWDVLTVPEYIPATQKALAELRATGRSTPYEKQYVRPDGSRWWGLFAGKRLSEHEGVKFVLDITESKQAEQQLQVMNEQLRRANIDLDSFIYTASHDLRAPIANIEGLLYHLRHELPAEVQSRYEVEPVLNMMQDAVERFQRTIAHLSDLTKLQKENDQPTTDLLLAPVIDDVRQDLQPLIAETGARVEVDVAACQRVSFSAKNLRSVLFNLLSNALKYRQPGRPPLVRVRCRAEEGYTVLAVEDNGLGIEPGRQEEVFTMFRRLHSHVEGSGLGLYMVKRVVENGGGRVEVQSQPGVGSTFSVYFPR